MRFVRDAIIANGERIPVQKAIPEPFEQERYGEMSQSNTPKRGKIATAEKTKEEDKGTPMAGTNVADAPPAGAVNGAAAPEVKSEITADTADESAFETDAPLSTPRVVEDTPTTDNPAELSYYAGKPVFIYGCGRDEKGKPWTTVRLATFRPFTPEETEKGITFPTQIENPHTALLPAEGSTNTRVPVSEAVYKWLLEKFVPAYRAFQERKVEGKFYRRGAGVVKGRGANSYAFVEWGLLPDAAPPVEKKTRGPKKETKAESFGV